MDDKILKEAFEAMTPDLVQKRRMRKKIQEGDGMKQRRHSKAGPVVVAAMLLLFFSVAMDRFNHRDPDPHDGRVLPALTFRMESEGMGYAGIMLFERDELQSENPWLSDWDVKVLPVFANPLEGRFMEDGGASEEAMRERAMELGGRLGWSIKDGDFPGSFVEEGGGEIQVYANLGARVSIPDTTHHLTAKTLEERRLQVKSLYDAYAPLFGFKEPKVEIWWDYFFNGEKLFHDAVFDGAGSDSDKLLQYSLGKVTLGSSEDKVSFQIPGPAPTRWLEDYPLISLKTAQDLLLRGESISSVPYEEKIHERDVVQAKLVYFQNPYGGTAVQPLYEFYVELEHDRQENGLIMYGIYYVPAIHRDYLDVGMDEMPFN